MQARMQYLGHKWLINICTFCIINYPFYVGHSYTFHVIFQTTKILPQKLRNQDPVQANFQLFEFCENILKVH